MNNQFPPSPSIPPPAPKNDRKGLAIAGFVLGILSLCAWLIPLCGFPMTIIGVILSALGIQSSQRTLAIVGVVLAALGLLATILNSALGAITFLQNPQLLNNLFNLNR
jgi:hypothetical protein